MSADELKARRAQARSVAASWHAGGGLVNQFSERAHTGILSHDARKHVCKHVDVEVQMTKIRRLLVLLAGLVGLLAIAETAANAGLSGVNHCEPLRLR